MNEDATNNPPDPLGPEGHFVEMLRGKAGGVSIAELDDKLARVVRACVETGRPATLTYTLKVKKNARRGVRILDDVKVKLPEEERGESFFFTAESGRLLRNNPEGPDLPGLVVTLAEVPEAERIRIINPV